MLYRDTIEKASDAFLVDLPKVTLLSSITAVSLFVFLLKKWKRSDWIFFCKIYMILGAIIPKSKGMFMTFPCVLSTV